MPTALFFDFDGLVCDTERAAKQSWELTYQVLGHTFPEHVWTRMTGRSNGHSYALDDLAGRLGRPVSEAEISLRLSHKQQLADEQPLRPGVIELLDAAAGCGLRTAVVSSSGRAWVGGHLDRLGVRERFDFVLTGDEVTPHKPAPDLYLRALELAGVAADTVIAFEDSATGVRAAKAAGLYCVAVPSSVGQHADLSAADEVLPSLLDHPLALARAEQGAMP